VVCFGNPLWWASTALLADCHQFKRVNSAIVRSQAVLEFGQDFVNVGETSYLLTARQLGNARNLKQLRQYQRIRVLMVCNTELKPRRGI